MHIILKIFGGLKMENTKVKLFQNKKIRTLWDEDNEEYLFSVIDIIAVLTESKNPSQYWRTLKSRLNDESNQTVTICNKLKMPAQDGKMRLTDVASTKQVLRIIQSVPSPNAEPFKQWLAKVGGERLDEIADPEMAISRAIGYYRQKGYSEEWISQRLFGIELRKDLTAEWNRVGVERSEEYGILTNEISKAWSGMTAGEYKKYKGLKKEGLRDNMTNMEQVLNMLAEVSTTEISKSLNPKGFEESKVIAKTGGNIAGNARREIESSTGRKVISRKSSKNPELL